MKRLIQRSAVQYYSSVFAVCMLSRVIVICTRRQCTSFEFVSPSPAPTSKSIKAARNVFRANADPFLTSFILARSDSLARPTRASPQYYEAIDVLYIPKFYDTPQDTITVSLFFCDFFLFILSFPNFYISTGNTEENLEL